MIQRLLVTIILLAFAFAAEAQTTLELNPARTVYIQDVIGPQALRVAGQIYKLAHDGKAPIDVVINSPGGDVTAGMQILSAFQTAKVRGVKIRCVVPVMAASMAFQIFANCDERYALHYSMLLWHPMRSVLQGEYTADDLLYEGQSTLSTEQPMLKQLQRALGMPVDQFLYHYHHETLWLADQLLPLTPSFMRIVDDIKGIKKPFMQE